MRVHHDIHNLPVFNRAVITIGTFDGLHLGHRKILDLLKQEAVAINGETVIITFDPHPRKVISPHKGEIQLINTTKEKIELFAAANINHVVIVPFTEEFSQLTANQYINNFLIEKFHPHTVIIGYDHHFGHGRKGDYRLLEKYSAKGFFTLKEIPAHVINQVTVSSTRIREAILKGEIEVANALLGYEFFFEGMVVEGNRIGRTLNFPTANIKMLNPEKLVPANGVYAVEVSGNWAGQTWFKGMMNIGVRPTIDGSYRVIEVNIFDFDKDIYNQLIRVRVKKYLRAEKKFEGISELKEQLERDKGTAKKALGNPLTPKPPLPP